MDLFTCTYDQVHGQSPTQPSFRRAAVYCTAVKLLYCSAVANDTLQSP